MTEVDPNLWAVGSSGMRDRLPDGRAPAYPIPVEWSDGVGSEPDMRLMIRQVCRGGADRLTRT